MSPTRMSRIESAMRVALAFNEAFNAHDVPAMMQLMSERCVFENTTPAPDGAVYTGRAEIARFWEELFATTPDAHIEIEEIFGFGNRCIMRWVYSWRNPDGAGEHVRGVDIFDVRDGKIRQKLSYVKG